MSFNIYSSNDREQMLSSITSLDLDETNCNILLMLLLCAFVEKNLPAIELLLSKVRRFEEKTLKDGVNQINWLDLYMSINQASGTSQNDSDLHISHHMESFFNLCFPDRFSGLPTYSKRRPIKFNYKKEFDKPLRIDLFIRELWQENDPKSRPFDGGFRLKESLRNSKWSPEVYPISTTLFDETTKTQRTDIAIIDLQSSLLFDPSFCHEFLSKARARYRALIAILFDPWMDFLPRCLQSYSQYFDILWNPTPEQSDKLRPYYRCHEMRFPFVATTLSRSALVAKRAERGSEDLLAFIGSISAFNRDRLFWRMALAEKPEIKFILSTHNDDQLDASRSYESFLDKITKYEYQLNFCKRSNGARVVTGRCFELISMNKALIQEECPELEYFLERDEHYLDFSTPDNLLGLYDNIRSDPRKIKKVMNSATEFFDAHYSNLKFQEHLNFLIHEL
ncbi:glycosyltransferase [Litoricolaceae bacterium]|nr:glycosyltransferase [Litorivicinaceae bacterium]